MENMERTGKKIVFTNGCFDLIHRGHIETLKRAKDLGDYLIVGLNSDLSIKKIKGKDRPILIQSSRFEIVSAIRYVDQVILFDDEHPFSLIRELKPHILVRGALNSWDFIAGSDFVRSYGGQVIILEHPFLDETTSSLIARIKQSERNN